QVDAIKRAGGEHGVLHALEIGNVGVDLHALRRYERSEPSAHVRKVRPRTLCSLRKPSIPLLHLSSVFGTHHIRIPQIQLRSTQGIPSAYSWSIVSGLVRDEEILEPQVHFPAVQGIQHAWCD